MEQGARPVKSILLKPLSNKYI